MDKNKVYLVQTDTTVGFSSSDDEKLSRVKQRPTTQKILQTVDSLATLKTKTRIPRKFKNKIRRAKKTTFIYPNSYSFRVINKEDTFYNFIKKFGCLYSTSANKTAHQFDHEFATSNAEIIVEDKVGFIETYASSIYKINTQKIKKIR